MEQFLAYLFWTDEFITDEEANLSILVILNTAISFDVKL